MTDDRNVGAEAMIADSAVTAPDAVAQLIDPQSSTSQGSGDNS